MFSENIDLHFSFSPPLYQDTFGVGLPRYASQRTDISVPSSAGSSFVPLDKLLPFWSNIFTESGITATKKRYMNRYGV